MFGSASGEGDSAQDAAGGRRGRSSKFARSNLPNESQRRDTAALFAAAPPVAIEAEMGLLGAVLWDPKMIGDVITVIRSGDDFSVPRHARIYDAMIELYDRHATVDLVLLNQLFLDRNLVEAVGGLDYLVQLAEGVPSAANAVHWARVVREKATTRELIAAAGEILEEAHTSRHPAQTLLENAEQKIFRIAQKRETGIVASAQELVNETMRLIDESEGKGFMGVRTGFAELDEMTNGFQKGEMIVLAARPSMGKTAMALNLMEQVAQHGTPSLMFSLEMGKQQLIQRMLCALGQIDSQKMRRHMLSSGEIEVSEISRGIKAMARELDVPVLCLSQLNRAAEQREGHRPRMSDLRESGSIEQDADVVAMLHREEYYHKADPNWADENPDKVGAAELIMAKQRNGPTGTCNLIWDGATTRFKNPSYSAPPDEVAPRRASAPTRMRAVHEHADDLPV